jgi:excisionase family DNA binding protein
MSSLTKGMKMDKEHEIMTVCEVADLLRVHPITIYRLLRTGRLSIPAFRIGSDWRFRRVEIDKWIEGLGVNK